VSWHTFGGDEELGASAPTGVDLELCCLTYDDARRLIFCQDISQRQSLDLLFAH
jgi:hypothetical protein